MSFGSCFEKHNRCAAISHFSTWFAKELSRERAFAEVFVQCLGGSDGEAGRLLSQNARKWKEKGQNQLKL
jgi:hypothetical protein